MEQNKIEGVVKQVVANEDLKEATKNVDLKKVGIGGAILTGVTAAGATVAYFVLKHFANKD